MAAFDECFVGSCARTIFTHKPGLAGHGGIKAEIPWLLIIDAAARFIKDDARV